MIPKYFHLTHTKASKPEHCTAYTLLLDSRTWQQSGYLRRVQEFHHL